MSLPRPSLPLPPGGPGGPPKPEGPPPLLDVLDQFFTPAGEILQPPPPQPTRLPPDIGTVQNRIDKAVSYWSDRDQRMDEDWQLYQLATDQNLASFGVDEISQRGGEILVRNLPFVAVEKVANMCAVEEPIFSVVAPAADKTAEAEKVQNLVHWMWDCWRRDWRHTGTNADMQRDMAHFLALRGWVAARVVWRADAGPGEMPVDFVMRDPRNVYPLPGHRGIRYVAFKNTMTYGEVVTEYPEAEGVLGEHDDDDDIEVTSYYDSWWFAVLADGQPVVEPQAHGYGFVPWIIAIASGAPVRQTNADSTSWIANTGPSIFHGIRRTYQQANKILSQVATEIARLGNPAKLYYVDLDQNDAPHEIDLSPGSTNYLVAPNERVEVIRTSPNPTDLSMISQVLGTDLERGTIPGILWGVVDTPGTSGYAVSLMSGAARDATFGITRAMEQVFEDASTMALRLMSTFMTTPVGVAVLDRQGRWVTGQDISKRDLDEVGSEVRARFRDIAPRDKVAYAQLAAQLSQARLISLRTAREEYLGLTNPDKENDQVLEELIFQDQDLVKNYLTPLALARYDPEIFQAWLAREARRVRDEEQAQAQTQAQALQKVQAPPVPGMPPGAVPPPQGPAPFNALTQASGASAGAAGAPTPAGLPGVPLPPVR